MHQRIEAPCVIVMKWREGKKKKERLGADLKSSWSDIVHMMSH